jgi:hypothetical protein
MLLEDTEDIYISVERSLREKESSHRMQWDGGCSDSVCMGEQILQVVERQPTLSTRLLVARTGTSHATVHEQRLYHYHIQSVQGLVPHNAPARSVFCQRILQQSSEGRTFTVKVFFFTGE